MSERIILAARWTDDCSGKKDYDGDILSVSTRYWPADGGFYVFRDGDLKPNDVLGKPSAKCSLLVWQGKDGKRDETGGDYVDLTEKEFEGDSFEEVARQVEAWAQEMTDRAVAALRREFAADASRPE